MKKLLALVALLVGFAFAAPALASNCSTYPYTLTNGTTADANQVMSNFTSILNCTNTSLAHNGANSDITSLSGLSTPLSVAQGGTGAATLTNHGVVLGQGTGAVAVTSAGTAGYALLSNGASADPTFQPITSGTVTSVTCNGGLSGGTITTTGTCAVAANGITLAMHATQTANTVIGNVTGSTATPTAAALPSCSATGSALNYTSGTGFGCATGYAPLASPTFTGTPAAPTATGGTNTTQIATTAFVASAISPLAPLASPTFTGTPAAPTATPGTNTTQIATTAYVATSYLTSATAASTYAPIASPAFTGSTPTSGGTALVLTNDSRFGGLTQNAQCTYSLVLSDAGKQIYCGTAGTHTLTIPANASVAFPVGTKIEVVNTGGAGVMTINITSDSLFWYPSNSSGSRSLAAASIVTLTKGSATTWIITGVGIT